MVIRVTVLKLTKPPCLQSHKRHRLKRSKNQWSDALWLPLLRVRAKQKLALLCVCGLQPVLALQVPTSVLTSPSILICIICIIDTYTDMYNNIVCDVDILGSII